MLRWDFELMFKHMRYTATGLAMLITSAAVAYKLMVVN